MIIYKYIKKYVILTITSTLLTFNANAYQWKSKTVFNFVKSCIFTGLNTEFCGCKAGEYQKIMSLNDLFEFENKLIAKDSNAIKKLTEIETKINQKCREMDLR